jgi:hypothetical protein
MLPSFDVILRGFPSVVFKMTSESLVPTGICDIFQFDGRNAFPVDGGNCYSSPYRVWIKPVLAVAVSIFHEWITRHAPPNRYL